MSLSLVTAPTEEPVTLREAKQHLRIPVTVNDEDNHVQSLITSARQQVEAFTGNQLITATWDWRIDSFAWTSLSVPLPPLQSVTSVTYLDENGDSQTWAASKYRVDTNSKPGRITLEHGETFPTTRSVTDAVTVRFVAGYGTDHTDVPEPIRRALLRWMSDIYEHRENVITGTISGTVPQHSVWMLLPYRRQWSEQNG